MCWQRPNDQSTHIRFGLEPSPEHGWDVLRGLDEVRWECKWTYHLPIATTVRRMELELSVGPPAWVEIHITPSAPLPPSELNAG
jgi:hypothetical protein